ncbi:MAG: DUF58 domain-containing protein [Bacilli bacterium]|nr:DUF58 domain-containing protein [Bacilli bacterium]
MRLQYIEKIRKNISIQASKKTVSLLEGLYKSVFHGKSMDFDDLRDYVVGDNSKDIDWKSSIRHGSLLIRRYCAYRRHNMIFIVDSGKKINGITESGENKSDIALYVFGTLAYLINKNEDEISTVYNKNGSIMAKPFKTGLPNIEMTINDLEKNILLDNSFSINELLEYPLKRFKRKMIFIVISDLDGANNITENMLKKITASHDLLFINISDASICDSDLYDLNEDKDIPRYISKNKLLKEEEKEIKKELIDKNNRKFKKYRISTVTISSKKEIVDSIIDLLERHNHAIRH